MGWNTKTTDWQVCGLGQVGYGAGYASGTYLCCFYSETASVSGLYLFSGIGAGVGGNASGVINPADYGAVSSPWTNLTNMFLVCGVREFSGNDLNGAMGRISSLGVGGLGVSYGVTYITAIPPWGSSEAYFYSQNIGGLGYGPGGGIGGQTLSGTWGFAATTNLRPW
ncbi:hypothetical protein [Spirosoma aerophilum]